MDDGEGGWRIVNVHWGPRELCRNLASYRQEAQGAGDGEEGTHSADEHPCKRQAQPSGLCPPTRTLQSLLASRMLQAIQRSSIRWLFMGCQD